MFERKNYVGAVVVVVVVGVVAVVDAVIVANIIDAVVVAVVVDVDETKMFERNNIDLSCFDAEGVLDGVDEVKFLSCC